ncbi:transcription factor HES-1-A-like [Microplitis mediator]|uniref:transcription factor HES-1-A-like n=1 Tax=Microplitis mediator TaxID=375433 RepID=UPI002552CD24|nr:transcription factor HES-1-A-like [Microplitis mediator]
MVDYCKYKMSGSDEEFDPQAQSGMSKAELRRSNKPIMEKRRRARINQCLDELKSLILEAMKKDPSRHSKLEKADILEMTVKHLQSVQRQQLSAAVATDPAVLTKFRTGFSECAGEVTRYVNHLENVDTSVKQRLVSHLNNCVSNLQQMAPFYGHYVPYMPERLFPEVKVGFQGDFHSGDENNNASARIQIPSGVQLIPSRLPTGELALLVPQSAGISANFPFFPPANESRVSRTSSAFTPVQRSHSPLLSPSTSTSSFGEECHGEFRQTESPGRFKIPADHSSTSSKSFSSPETQKAQISSSSDRKSPSAFVDPKHLDAPRREEEVSRVRQPLSVITDKTYNRAVQRKDLKRHNSDGLLVISEKRPKYSEASSSSSANSGLHSTRQEFAHSVEDLSGRSNLATKNRNVTNPPAAASSQANADMWRPW